MFEVQERPKSCKREKDALGFTDDFGRSSLFLISGARRMMTFQLSAHMAFWT